MLNEQEILRACFAHNDPVGFPYRRRELQGTLIRMNPRRGVVRVGDEEYDVPYECLRPLNDPDPIRREKIESIALQSAEWIRQYGLKGWTFRFDYSRRRAGCCNYRDRMISISIDLALNAADHEIRDTVLHEIAHALVGRRHGHDAVWRAKAKAIGCSAERCHRIHFVLPRYTVRCENGCWTDTAERKNIHLICRSCKGRLMYAPFNPQTGADD